MNVDEKFVHQIEISSEDIIPLERFNNRKYIEDRCGQLEVQIARKFNSVLRYLYLTEGPNVIFTLNNKDKNLIKKLGLLEPRELIMLNYLFSRTNGTGKYDYGRPAIIVARSARYRCQECSIPDVKTLCIDHVWNDYSTGEPSELLSLQMLCQNCHARKTRTESSRGQKMQRDKKTGIKKLIAQIKSNSNI